MLHPTPNPGMAPLHIQTHFLNTYVVHKVAERPSTYDTPVALVELVTAICATQASIRSARCPLLRHPAVQNSVSMWCSQAQVAHGLDLLPIPPLWGSAAAVRQRSLSCKFWALQHN